MTELHQPWPELPLDAWQDTYATLHLWTQIVGKVRLGLAPFQNHWWNAAFYVNTRGVTTSPIPYGDEAFELQFDFIDHRLKLHVSTGEKGSIALAPKSVAAFYAEVFSMLRDAGIKTEINPMPQELPNPIPFDQDEIHASYDPEYANRLWRILLATDSVFKEFRGRFIGKSSPVHFFWGSFDLAVTRFSGRRAPLHPGGVPNLSDEVTQEAYSHEVSSAGFWPGNESFPRAAFYSYAWPEPQGFRDRPLTPGARYDTTLGEFILPYDSMRKAPDPDATLLDFLTRTYEAAADAAHWDRAALECPLGVPGRVRPLIPSAASQ